MPRKGRAPFRFKRFCRDCGKPFRPIGYSNRKSCKPGSSSKLCPSCFIKSRQRAARTRYLNYKNKAKL